MNAVSNKALNALSKGASDFLATLDQVAEEILLLDPEFEPTVQNTLNHIQGTYESWSYRNENYPEAVQQNPTEITMETVFRFTMASGWREINADNKIPGFLASLPSGNISVIGSELAPAASDENQK